MRAVHARELAELRASLEAAAAAAASAASARHGAEVEQLTAKARTAEEATARAAAAFHTIERDRDAARADVARLTDTVARERDAAARHLADQLAKLEAHHAAAASAAAAAASAELHTCVFGAAGGQFSTICMPPPTPFHCHPPAGSEKTRGCVRCRLPPTWRRCRGSMAS